MADRTTLAAYDSAAARYAVAAFDGSEALLGQARKRHPGLALGIATLTGRTEIGTRQAANVLCETVIMRLPVAEIAEAAGRLYELVEPALIRGALSGAVVLYDEGQCGMSSGKTVHRIIARRPG